MVFYIQVWRGKFSLSVVVLSCDSFLTFCRENGTKSEKSRGRGYRVCLRGWSECCG